MRAAIPLLATWLLAAAPGCSGGREGRTPEGAVRLLIAAARAGDRAGVFQRLSPRTRARVQAMQESTRRTGGRLVMRPEDFLSVGWAPPAWEPAGMRTLRREGDSAEVEVYSSAGDRQTVPVVREGEEWKIELPGQ
jgi:hypothetical protein